MYDRILVPTDGSEAADRAVAEALDLAERFDAEVHALYVVDTGALAFGSADEEDMVFDDRALIDALETEGESSTMAVDERARERGLEVVTAVTRGDPERAILEYADEHDVDLLVMGTHGRRGIDRFLLGSTTERVVRKSTVPVLTIRGDADADGE